MLTRRVLILLSSTALHLGCAILAVLLTGVGDTSPILIDLTSDVTGQAMEEGRSQAWPAPVLASVSARRPRAGPRKAAAPAEAPASTPSTRAPAPKEEQLAASPGAEPGPAAHATPAAPAEPSASAESTSAEPAPPAIAANPGPVIAGPAADMRAHGAERGPASGVTGKGAGEGGGAGVTSGPSASPARGSSSGSEGGSADRPTGGGGSSPVAARPDDRDPIPPEYGPYLQSFRRRVQESLEYPLAARRRGLSGTVELEVLVESSGRVTDVRLVSSSRHAVLDDAALRAVQGLVAEPFPARLPRRPLRIRLPLTFELR